MLKSNNQAVIRKMAVRSIRSNRKKNSLYLVAIVLAVLMLFTVMQTGASYMHMQYVWRLHSVGELYDGILMGGVTKEQEETVKAEPGIEVVGKPYEESQDSAMKIFGGKIAEELAKDNQRAEYGGEEMQEISIQYWLEKKENETKEEVIGQKYFDKNDTGFEKVFFKAPSSGEKQSGKIVWMDIFLGVCMVGLIGISVCLKD